MTTPRHAKRRRGNDGARLTCGPEAKVNRSQPCDVARVVLCVLACSGERCAWPCPGRLA